MPNAAPAVVEVRGLVHRYRGRPALDRIDLELRTGDTLGVIGPDGVGKSTLLSLLAGERRLDLGGLRVLGADMASRKGRARVSGRIAYMAQGLGSNLYPDLSVRENVGFFARLFAVPREDAKRRISRLLEATQLLPHADRLVRRLSGGMKQKLALCCALVHEPALLVLDEPTTGVDPLSRRGFWELLAALRRETPELSVVVATAYLEEAEAFERLLMLHAGRLLAAGAPEELRRRTGSATLEEAYAALLAGERAPPRRPAPRARRRAGGPPAIEARELVRRFGSVLAVAGVSFEVERGEVFGFVGPNGCGKTTTMKMVTGILPPSSGEARLLGERVRAGSLGQRRLVGYMAQSFSLQGELTARENLRFYGRLLGLSGDALSERAERLARRLGLAERLDERAAALPLGHRQRLALAVAVLHEPALLVLDEPTSGVDPLARDGFWATIAELAHGEGTTVFLSTHYLSEAARCDRVALMNAGRLLAVGAPSELTERTGRETLEEAFVDLVRADDVEAR